MECQFQCIYITARVNLGQLQQNARNLNSGKGSVLVLLPAAL